MHRDCRLSFPDAVARVHHIGRSTTMKTAVDVQCPLSYRLRRVDSATTHSSSGPRVGEFSEAITATPHLPGRVIVSSLGLIETVPIKVLAYIKGSSCYLGLIGVIGCFGISINRFPAASCY